MIFSSSIEPVYYILPLIGFMVDLLYKVKNKRVHFVFFIQKNDYFCGLLYEIFFANVIWEDITKRTIENETKHVTRLVSLF